jgi:predicted ATPase
MFELMRGDLATCARLGESLLEIAREHDLAHWKADGAFLGAWAEWRAHPSAVSLAKLRDGAARRDERKIFNFYGLIKIALARAEAQSGQVDAALATLASSLAESERAGQACFDAETLRVRGEILARGDAANLTLAEEAFHAAIAVARSQKIRSFELRATFGLAKLHQSTGRPVEAHDVLGPALEGFSPTLGFPEIAEARELLDELARGDSVRNTTASRKHRVQLQKPKGRSSRT